MINRDEELYHACMNFCQVLTRFLFKKEEYNNHKFFGYGVMDEVELEERMEFERERLRKSFCRLKEVVDKVDGEINE